MKEKIQLAIKDMESKIERDSKHVYRNVETGGRLQGVSTVSSIIPKDWLAAWGAKEAVKFLGYSDYEGDIYPAIEKMIEIGKIYKDFGFAIQSIDQNNKMSEEQLSSEKAKVQSEYALKYIAILKEAKGASTRKSKKAMVDGTLGHSWLETYVESKIYAKEPPILPISTPLERPIKQFLEWESKEVDYWIASEALVCNLEKAYAGQLDAIYMSKSGELTLADFKFASNISEDYYLQCAGYQACFEKYGIKFDKRVIIRLPKTLEKEDWVNFKYVKVPNNIEVKVVPTNYEADRDVFYACLPVKAWINYIEKLNK